MTADHSIPHDGTNDKRGISDEVILQVGGFGNAYAFGDRCRFGKCCRSAVQGLRSSTGCCAVYNWTGLYVGVNGGYGWGQQDPLTLFSNRFDRSSFNINGGMFGGTVGAQIQQGYVVLGLEGDLDWANIKGTGISTPTIGGCFRWRSLSRSILRPTSAPLER